MINGPVNLYVFPCDRIEILKSEDNICLFFSEIYDFGEYLCPQMR